MDDLYHQEILDHYHHPDNYGELKNADFVISETNASCGDSFVFYIVLDKQKTKIKKLLFTGTGCAISTAACSMLTSELIGKPLKAVETLDVDYMQSLIGTTITPTRLKCLMLPVKALAKIHKH